MVRNYSPSIFRCEPVQGFFEILELKFTSVNEHFKISKVTKKLALVKNANFWNYYCKLLVLSYFCILFKESSLKK